MSNINTTPYWAKHSTTIFVYTLQLRLMEHWIEWEQRGIGTTIFSKWKVCQVRSLYTELWPNAADATDFSSVMWKRVKSNSTQNLTTVDVSVRVYKQSFKKHSPLGQAIASRQNTVLVISISRLKCLRRKAIACSGSACFFRCSCFNLCIQYILPAMLLAAAWGRLRFT